MKNFDSINDYIKSQPKEVQPILQKVRETIAKAAPKAEEAMRYGIPTFRLNDKNLVHFGGFKKHIGFYPAPSGLVAFKDEISKYENNKGSVQFPYDKIPFGLINKIVKYRIKEENEKLKAKTVKKK